MEPRANVRMTATDTKKPTMRPTSNGARAIATAAVIAVAAAFAGAASAAPMRSSSAAPCTFVAKGAAWTFKGQKGSTYSVVVIGGASCATARTWVPRLTHEHAAFDLKPEPAGWHCSTASGVTTGLTMTGQCTTHAGGIVEWLPKLKK